jgi:hypothetical protein
MSRQSELRGQRFRAKDGDAAAHSGESVRHADGPAAQLARLRSDSIGSSYVELPFNAKIRSKNSLFSAAPLNIRSRGVLPSSSVAAASVSIVWISVS